MPNELYIPELAFCSALQCLYLICDCSLSSMPHSTLINTICCEQDATQKLHIDDYMRGGAIILSCCAKITVMTSNGPSKMTILFPHKHIILCDLSLLSGKDCPLLTQFDPLTWNDVGRMSLSNVTCIWDEGHSLNWTPAPVLASFNATLRVSTSLLWEKRPIKVFARLRRGEWWLGLS